MQRQIDRRVPSRVRRDLRSDGLEPDHFSGTSSCVVADEPTGAAGPPPSIWLRAHRLAGALSPTQGASTQPTGVGTYAAGLDGRLTHPLGHGCRLHGDRGACETRCPGATPRARTLRRWSGQRPTRSGTAIVRVRGERPRTTHDVLGADRRSPRGRGRPDRRFLRRGRRLPSEANSVEMGSVSPGSCSSTTPPDSAYSVGWSRYVLERRYAQRTDRGSGLQPRISRRSTDYDVIVFPSGNYGGADRRRACVDDLFDPGFRTAAR